MTKRYLVVLAWLAAGFSSPILAQKVGPEFQVNTYTTEAQVGSVVASDASGNFLVVRKPIRIVSTHPLGTTLQFKGPNGGPLLTDYDVIDGTPYGDDKIHRGIGFLLWSETVVIAPQAPLEDLPALYLENIQLVTGMVAEKGHDLAGLRFQTELLGHHQQVHRRAQ